MRNILFISGAALFMNLMIACSTNPSELSSDAAATVEVDMKVEGMVCAMGCAKYIQDEVAGLDGVLSSSVDFETGIAHFELDESKTNAEALENFIDDIHDGQYQAEIMASQEKEEVLEQESEEVVSKKEEVSSVQERFKITIPGLLSYFLKSLR